MADGLNGERQSIRDSAKSLKKYGSTCNHFKRQDHIKHIIVEGDTLQGIALKYGVTMEQIRRANLLWATDSLFLRESLLIPVTKESAISDMMPERYSLTGRIVTSPLSPESQALSEKSVDDFLVAIDTSIANTKNQVKKSQGHSEFRDDDDLYAHRRPAVSRLRQQQQQQQQQQLQLQSNGTDDLLNTPHPVVMTQGRKVRTSLQRLQREQDEIFEL
ncbi:lysM and putative peptidoglycan-binding domain-containing protein 2 [Bacillus rossius redtenbacheri]|uniref:lysM and putative peptidoglycan-binding domain-containing protein 2 n=1 Tax=Bacillus rossius redtenbacheri TaxID=93214 RepID=UPI002FDC9B4E